VPASPVPLLSLSLLLVGNDTSNLTLVHIEGTFQSRLEFAEACQKARHCRRRFGTFEPAAGEVLAGLHQVLGLGSATVLTPMVRFSSLHSTPQLLNRTRSYALVWDNAEHLGSSTRCKQGSAECGDLELPSSVIIAFAPDIRHLRRSDRTDCPIHLPVPGGFKGCLPHWAGKRLDSASHRGDPLGNPSAASRRWATC
jgi:hypothetical protein